jgi:hypothetical protein
MRDWWRRFAVGRTLRSPDGSDFAGTFIMVCVVYSVFAVAAFGSEWQQRSMSGRVVTAPVALIEPLLPDKTRSEWMKVARNYRRGLIGQPPVSPPRAALRFVLLAVVGSFFFAIPGFMIGAVIGLVGSGIAYGIMRDVAIPHLAEHVRKLYAQRREAGSGN